MKTTPTNGVEIPHKIKKSYCINIGFTLTEMSLKQLNTALYYFLNILPNNSVNVMKNFPISHPVQLPAQIFITLISLRVQLRKLMNLKFYHIMKISKIKDTTIEIGIYILVLSLTWLGAEFKA